MFLCFFTFTLLSCNSSNTDNYLALIGDTFIKEGDLNYTIEIEKAHGYSEIKRGDAMVILINDTIEVEIGKLVGVEVTASDINNYSSLLDKSSMEQELLNKVKDIFGSNKATYNRLYLSPRILNRKIRKTYNSDSELHKASITAIKKAKSLIDKGTSLEKAATLSGTDYKNFEVGTINETIESDMPDALKKFASDKKKSELKDPIFELVSKMEAGQVFVNILENDNEYKIVKLIKNKGSGFEVETVSVNRIPINKWFREHGKFIQFKIIDTTLKKYINSKYKYLWWIKNIN